PDRIRGVRLAWNGRPIRRHRNITSKQLQLLPAHPINIRRRKIATCIWQTFSVRVERGRLQSRFDAISLCPLMNSIEVILNTRSGSHRTEETHRVLEQVFGNSGRSFHISVARGDEICRIAEEKAASDCQVLVAAGGDGT